MPRYVLLAFCIFLGSVRDAQGFRLRRSHRDQNASAVNKTKERVYEYKVHLQNYQNVQYFGEFTIGSQTIPVVYDTGSSEVIVLSTLCHDCKSGSVIYDSRTSPTFQEGDGATAEHIFGSGPVLAKRGLDVGQLGPISSPLLTTMMPFWQVVDHKTAIWNDKYSQYSGIVGLAHSTAADNLAGHVLLEHLGYNSFSICLQRGAGTPPGWLKMGELVESAEGSALFKHVPVIGQSFWAVTMNDLTAGGQERFNPCKPSCAAIIDSDTSLIAAPPAAMDALAPLFNSIKKDCSNPDKLPDIQFSFAGIVLDIPPMIYVMQLTHYVEKPQTSQYSPAEVITVTECVPSFMSLNMRTSASEPIWIFGMPFLRYYHTVFQRIPRMMHMAYSDPGCEPTAYKPSVMLNMSASTNGSATSGFDHVAHVGLNKAGPAKENAGFRLPPWAKEGAILQL